MIDSSSLGHIFELMFFAGTSRICDHIKSVDASCDDNNTSDAD